MTNDFFVNLLDTKYVWKATSDSQDTFEGSERNRASQVSEVHACSDSQPKFVKDFVSAWHKMMNLDRFDIVQTV